MPTPSPVPSNVNHGLPGGPQPAPSKPRSPPVASWLRRYSAPCLLGGRPRNRVPHPLPGVSQHPSESVTLERAVSLGKRGGQPGNRNAAKESAEPAQGNEGDNDNLRFRGTSRDYITARLVRDGHSEDAQAVQVELLSARKLGEMLAATVNHEGGRPKKNTDTMSGFSLPELGIGHKQSSRWQQLAAVPRDAFDDYGLDGRADLWQYT